MKNLGNSVFILLALIIGAYFLASVFNLLPEPSPQAKKKYHDAANEPLIDDDYWVEKGTDGIGYVVDKSERGVDGFAKTIGNLGFGDAKRSLLYIMPFALIFAIIFIIFLFFRIKRLRGLMEGVTAGIWGLAGGMNQVAKSAQQVAGEAGAMAGASGGVEGHARQVSTSLLSGTGIIALLLFLLFLLILLLRGGFIHNMQEAWNRPSNTEIKHHPNSLPDDQEIEIIGEQEVPLGEDGLYLDSDYDSNRQLYDYEMDNYIYQVQLGRFLNEPADLTLYTHLKHLGHIEAEVTNDHKDSERVTLGDFYTRPTADSVLNIVRDSGFNDAFVIMKDYPNTFGEYHEGSGGNQALAGIGNGQVIRVGVFQKPPYHTLSSLNDLGYMLFPPRRDGLVEVYLTATEFENPAHRNQVLQAVQARGFKDAFVTPLKPVYYAAKSKKQQAGYTLSSTKKATTEYMIQLEASEKPNIDDYQQFSKYGNLYTEDDTKRYFIRVLLGPYFNENKAYQVAKQVKRDGASGAFIQRYGDSAEDDMRRKYRDLIYVKRR